MQDSEADLAVQSTVGLKEEVGAYKVIGRPGSGELVGWRQDLLSWQLQTRGQEAPGKRSDITADTR